MRFGGELDLPFLEGGGGSGLMRMPKWDLPAPRKGERGGGICEGCGDYFCYCLIKRGNGGWARFGEGGHMVWNE